MEFLRWATGGPIGMHGTAGSGIAIATNMMVEAGDSLALGRRVAHEICHMFGLFHTTETDGTVFDSLPDTPVCPIENDADGKGLRADDCSALGEENLMFPTSDATGITLTPDQQVVIKRAMILH